jgi:hypothetical protein
MRLQHSHRQRFILSQLVMKRAQINLWPPNFATGALRWPDDTAIRTSMMRHNSLSEERKMRGASRDVQNDTCNSPLRRLQHRA